MIELPAVTKNARGTKHKCLSCDLPFYDLARTPIVCPNCSETFVPVVAAAPRLSEPKPISNGRRAPWSQKKATPEPVADEPLAAADADDVEDVEDEDEIEADDDTLLDPDAEIDDDEVVVATKDDND
ncbi:MAG: FYDLN acid domain-containing protein [Alphaproteobacteria bacterium]|nr:FYDLN acid domain-containing protein [Alphaproteobacteria bacterium]